MGCVGTYVVLDRVAEWHEVLRIPVLDYGVVALLPLGLGGRPLGFRDLSPVVHLHLKIATQYEY